MAGPAVASPAALADRLILLSAAVEVRNNSGKAQLRDIEIEWTLSPDAGSVPLVRAIRVDGKDAPDNTRCVVSETSGSITGELYVPSGRNRAAGNWRFQGAVGDEAIGHYSVEQAERRAEGTLSMLLVYSSGEGNDAAIRMWLPDVAIPLRGIFIWGNGAHGDARNKVLDERWRAFCRYYGLAFVATSRFGNDMRGGEGRRLLWQLMEIANKAGRPELADAPVVFSGHSNGGQMAWEFNAAFPERTIAISVCKGGVYETFAGLPLASTKTPVIMVIGERDEPRRGAAIMRLFGIHREQPRPWAVAVERGTGHVVGRSEDVWLPFFAFAIKRRLSGKTQSKNKRATTLDEIDLSSGWISDRRGALHPVGRGSDGESGDGSWLPDAGTGLAYKALTVYDRSIEIVASPKTGVLPLGAILRLGTDSSDGATWTMLEMWVDGECRKVLTRKDPELELRLTKSGVHSAVAVAWRKDGRVSLSAPRAWVVEAGPTETTR